MKATFTFTLISIIGCLACYIPVSAIAKINLAIIIQIFNIVTVATKFIFFKPFAVR